MADDNVKETQAPQTNNEKGPNAPVGLSIAENQRRKRRNLATGPRSLRRSR